MTEYSSMDRYMKWLLLRTSKKRAGSSRGKDDPKVQEVILEGMCGLYTKKGGQSGQRESNPRH